MLLDNGVTRLWLLCDAKIPELQETARLSLNSIFPIYRMYDLGQVLKLQRLHFSIL